MTIKVALDRPEKESDFQARLPAIRDSLLLLLTSKESRNLRTVNGKRRVRSEIMSRANGILKKGKITQVFFTDFIIQ
jgi:flagellar FliL protein